MMTGFMRDRIRRGPSPPRGWGRLRRDRSPHRAALRLLRDGSRPGRRRGGAGRPRTRLRRRRADRARATGRLTPAEYALERARSLFSLAEVRWRWGAVERPDPHDATPILRDLRAALPHLRGRDRAAARADPRAAQRPRRRPVRRRLLAVRGRETALRRPRLRPLGRDDPRRTAARGPRRIRHPGLGRDHAGHVRRRLGGRGGRPRLRAAALGRRVYAPTAATRVWTCTSWTSAGRGTSATARRDDPTAAITTRVSAYCVLDDDFADPILTASRPGGRPARYCGARVLPRGAVRLRLARGPLVHGGHGGLDRGRGVRRRERPICATSAGAARSRRPDVPLDTGRLGLRVRAPGSSGATCPSTTGRGSSAPLDPRRRRRRLLASRDPPRTRGARLRPDDRVRRLRRREPDAALRVPRRRSVSAGRRDEGALPRRDPDTGWLGLRVAHLATKTRTPAAQARGRKGAHRRGLGRTGRALGGGDARRRPERKAGSPRRRVPLDDDGHGRASVALGGSVRRVDVVLTNAGSAYRCWRGTDLSCQGVSLDDNRLFRVRASL